MSATPSVARAGQTTKSTQGNAPCDNAKYSQALRNKLLEEVDEYLAEGNAEELADILEVVYSLAKNQGISKSKLENIRLNKTKEKGSFNKGIILK